MEQAPVQMVGARQTKSTSICVGDLEENVIEPQLQDLFSTVGEVKSVRLYRDAQTRGSLRNAYVNYVNPSDGEKALEMLNYTSLNGKPIPIMYSNSDPSVFDRSATNIFIKNLDKETDNKALSQTFSVSGNIHSYKIADDDFGQFKGNGFVRFDQEETAQNTIKNLSGMLMNGKQNFEVPILQKQDQERSIDSEKFTNVFVKNFSETTTEDDLHQVFGLFGTITRAVVMREGVKSRGFGFVNFDKPEAAAKAVESLDGKEFDKKVWHVGKAQKKTERQQILKEAFEQKFYVDKNNVTNLYVKNMDNSIDDNMLREYFSQFGTITSCKVMLESNGVSRGFGVAAFSTAKEASHAYEEMNGKIVAGKPLYVAYAERKEDRHARLQANFLQMQTISTTSATSQMPMYPGQNLLESRNSQLLPPGMRPSGSPTKDFCVAMVQQGQQGQLPLRRGSGIGSMHQNQHQIAKLQNKKMHQRNNQKFYQMPMLQKEMLPRDRPFRYLDGRNSLDSSPGGTLNGKHGIRGLPIRKTTIPEVSIAALSSALSNATPAQQKTMLGERLYPLVEKLEYGLAAKITGMLLEMDKAEVLHLLESPVLLKAKVAEAMGVLMFAIQHSGALVDQLAALSSMSGHY